MSSQIVIVDSNTQYAISLMEYINYRQDVPLTAAAYFDGDALNEVEGDVDLILYDEDLPFCKEEIMGIPKLRLTSRRTSDANSVFRYQRADEIIHRVLSVIGTVPLVEKMDCQIYGIYSPIGRSGKSTLAKSICDYYPQSLYVGMEDYPGFSLMDVTEKSMKNSEKFFYYWLGKEPGIVEFVKEELIASAINSRQSYYVEGMLSSKDYRSIGREHMEFLCDLIRNCGYFTRVVFDFGCGVIDDFSILYAMDRLIVPTIEGDMEGNKLKVFQNRMKLYPELSKKIIYVEDLIGKDMKALMEREGL